MDYINGAIVDNWLFELVADLLIGDSENRSKEENQAIVKALLDFLDIIVLNENIVYESTYSYVWDDNDFFDQLIPYTVGIKAIQCGENKFKIYDIGDIDYSSYPSSDYPFLPNNINSYIKVKHTLEDVVKNGAEYYFGIAQALGIQYWPAPKRQNYIEATHKKLRDDFLVVLESKINEGLREIASDVLEKFPQLTPTKLPGFGARILADCADKKSIIQTAIQMREDPYCVAFRDWCREMDQSLETGNVTALCNSMKDVSVLLSDLSKRFSIKNPEGPVGVTLQLGLRPSISIDRELIGLIIKKFLPKKMHLVFLRKHIERVLENTNIAFQVRRLFGIDFDANY